jgi:hypothetical protein
MPNFPLNLPISVSDAGATKQLSRISQSMEALTKHTTKLSGAFQNAFQFYVRFRIFGLINRAISSLENLIPGLISRGLEWARTLDDIRDSTGLSAERSSVLAGIVQVMTGGVENLTRALGALAQSTVNHGDELRRYGIKTKNANGELLDTWSILQNVRKALSETGNSFITTAAARDLFSRGGQTLLDLVTMSDKAFRMWTQDMKASGAVMSEEGLRITEQWDRTTRRLEMQITGVANTLLTAIGPSIMRFVDQVTEFVRANLKEIVSFLASVAGAVIGFASGLLGLNINLKAFAEKTEDVGKGSDKLRSKLGRFAETREQQAKAEDHYSDAIKRQIDAIDRQLARMTARDRAEDARRVQRELLKDIADAQKELSDLRGKSIFAAGMSAAEAELARQQQTADIVAGQEKVAEARRKLAEHNRKIAMDERRFELEQRKAGLQEQLAAHMKAIAATAAADREAVAQVLGKGGIGKQVGNVSAAVSAGMASISQSFSEWSKSGTDARTALDNLVAKLQELWGSFKANFPNWIKALQNVAGAIDKVAGFLSSIVDKVFGVAKTVGGGLGISPDALVLGGGLALMFRGTITKVLSPLVRGFAGGAPAAGAGLGARGLAGAARVAGRIVAPLAAVLAWQEVFNTINDNSKIFEEAKAGNFAKLDAWLKVASGPELAASIKTLTDLPASLDPVAGTIYGLSSGLAGLDVILGNAKEHNEKIIAKLEAELVARKEADKAVGTTMGALLTDTRWGGRGVAQLVQQSNDHLSGFGRPGSLFGTANVNIYLPDGSFVVGVSNAPLRTGNSSIRTNRNN